MKTRNLLKATSSLLVLFLAVINVNGQNNASVTNSSKGTIEVIQFHSENRCMTCNKIESLTKETLKLYPAIKFSLVNVDDKQNQKRAEQFEATGTALFIYDQKSGKKKDLTDFAFMNASNKDKFISGLKKEIEAFQKQ